MYKHILWSRSVWNFGFAEFSCISQLIDKLKVPGLPKICLGWFMDPAVCQPKFLPGKLLSLSCCMLPSVTSSQALHWRGRGKAERETRSFLYFKMRFFLQVNCDSYQVCFCLCGWIARREDCKFPHNNSLNKTATRIGADSRIQSKCPHFVFSLVAAIALWWSMIYDGTCNVVTFPVTCCMSSLAHL